jgi:hypothetical protein
VVFLVDALIEPVTIRDITVQICNEDDKRDESFQSHLKVRGSIEIV